MFDYPPASKAVIAYKLAKSFRKTIQRPDAILHSYITTHPDDITEIETPEGRLNSLFALVYRLYA